MRHASPPPLFQTLALYLTARTMGYASSHPMGLLSLLFLTSGPSYLASCAAASSVGRPGHLWDIQGPLQSGVRKLRLPQDGTTLSLCLSLCLPFCLSLCQSLCQSLCLPLPITRGRRLSAWALSPACPDAVTEARVSYCCAKGSTAWAPRCDDLTRSIAQSVAAPGHYATVT